MPPADLINVTRLLQKNQGQDHKEYKISGTEHVIYIVLVLFESKRLVLIKCSL